MLQVGPDRLKTIYCIYCTCMWQKQIIVIFFKTTQYGSSNVDITKRDQRPTEINWVETSQT